MAGLRKKQIHDEASKLQAIHDTLETMLESKQETLDNEESRDYPNDEKLEKYQGQLDIIESAMGDLEIIIDALLEYE